jgi:membrane associated rhomboid family serine protease
MRKEEQILIKNFIPPLIFVAILWIVKGIEMHLNISFAAHGVFPRSIENLDGILFMPFLHDDLKHLFSNTVPLLVLGGAMVTFYRDVYLRVFFSIWLLHGTWLWVGGRPAYHIGASGIIYGLASFIFFGGVFRREKGMMALSLLVVFLYGSMVWGLFPLFEGMSWEAHLFGAISGALLAWYYRKSGVQRQVYDWELEDDDGPEMIFIEGEPPIQDEQLSSPENNLKTENESEETSETIKIQYDFKPKESNNDDVKN